jgi:hypothetical protein
MAMIFVMPYMDLDSTMVDTILFQKGPGECYPSGQIFTRGPIGVKFTFGNVVVVMASDGSEVFKDFRIVDVELPFYGTDERFLHFP